MLMSYAVQVQETHAERSHRVRLPFHFAQVHVRSQWPLAHVLGQSKCASQGCCDMSPPTQRLKAAGLALLQLSVRAAWAAFHRLLPPQASRGRCSSRPACVRPLLCTTPTSCSVVLSPTAIWVLFLPVRVLAINLSPSGKSRMIMHLCILKLVMTARYLLPYKAPHSSFRLVCAHLWGPSASFK